MIIWGLFLVPFVPLAVTPRLYFPFVTGKALGFRVLMEVLFGLWLLLVIVAPDQRPRRFGRSVRDSAITVALLAFLGTLALSTFLGQDPYRSFWSGLERMEGLVTHLHLAGYFVLLVSVFRTRKLWFTYLNLSIAVSVIVGLVALERGGNRLVGPLGSAPFLATYMLGHCVTSAWMWLRSRRLGLWPHVYLPVALFQSYIIFQTGTRGSLLALALGLGVALVAARLRHGRWAAGKAALVLLGLMGSTAWAFWSLRHTSFVQENYTLWRFSWMQDNPRPTIWKMALEAIKDRPVVGWGLDNYSLVFGRYYDPSMGLPGEWIDRAHNAPLDWMVSAGLLGLTGYLLLFGAALYVIWRDEARFTTLDRSMLTGLLAALFVNGLFVFDTLASYLFFVALLACLHRGASGQVEQADMVGSSPPTRWRAAAAAVLISVATVATAYAVNWRPYLAARELAAAADPALAPARQLRYLEDVFALGAFAAPEASELVSSLPLYAFTQATGVSRAEKRRLVDLALERMVGQSARVPDDVRFPYFAGRLLLNVGEASESIVFLERALEVSPRMPLIWLSLSVAHLERGDMTEALQAARHAHELNPEVPETRSVYAQVAIYNGDLRLARTLLGVDEPFKPEMLLDDRLVQAYSAIDRQDELIRVWRTHASVKPRFREKLERYLQELEARRGRPGVK